MTIGRHHGIHGHPAHHGFHGYHGHGNHHGIHGYPGHHGHHGHHGIHGYPGHHGHHDLHGYDGYHNQHGHIHHGYQGHQSPTTVIVASQRATSPKDARRRCLVAAVIPVFVGVLFIIFGALNISGDMGSEAIGIALLVCGSISLVATALMFGLVFFNIWKLKSSQDTQTSRMEHGNFPPPSGSTYPPCGSSYPTPGTDNPSFSSSYPTFGSPYPQHGPNYQQTGTVNPAFGSDHPTAGLDYPSSGSAYPSSGSAYPPSDSSLPPYPYPQAQSFQLPAASSNAGHAQDVKMSDNLS